MIIPPSDPGRIDNGPPPDLRTAQTTGKEHGRVETRKIVVTAEAVPHLDWPGLAQIARLTRTRESGGRTSTETVYLVTSLTATEASPERLLALNRAHWAIENKLHHVRDVSMEEDRCRVRAGARALAGVRNAALGIIRSLGRPIRQTREDFREDRAEAVKAVTGRIL